jgi:polysaccharide export outer membrane protein
MNLNARQTGCPVWSLHKLGPVALALFALTSGCDLMPSDGPNANNVVARVSENLKPTAVMRVAMVGIDARIAQEAQAFYAPVAPSVPEAFRDSTNFGRAGIGDVLRITLWEATDSGIFSSKERKGAEVTVRVDVDGTIAIPYAGRFPVAGRRLSQIESEIVQRLKDQAVQPQATVMIENMISSSASVQGEVGKPGPYPILKPDQRVLDVLALAGGAKYPPYDTNVRLTRGNSTMSMSLQDVITQPNMYNVSISAGDTLLFTRLSQKFMAFGSVLQPGEQLFKRTPLSLSDALGQIAGLDSNRADAKGIYLFRREPVALARQYGVQLIAEDRETVPIVYQLDFKDPRSFFVMSNFPVVPNDIVYVSTAPLAELRNFLQILSGASATVAIPRTLGTNFPAGGT